MWKECELNLTSNSAADKRHFLLLKEADGWKKFFAFYKAPLMKETFFKSCTLLHWGNLYGKTNKKRVFWSVRNSAHETAIYGILLSELLKWIFQSYVAKAYSLYNEKSKLFSCFCCQYFFDWKPFCLHQEAESLFRSCAFPADTDQDRILSKEWFHLLIASKDF